jgi:hypothetical protein
MHLRRMTTVKEAKQLLTMDRFTEMIEIEKSFGRIPLGHDDELEKQK